MIRLPDLILNNTGNELMDDIILTLISALEYDAKSAEAYRDGGVLNYDYANWDAFQKAADKAAGVLNAALEFPVRHASSNQ